MKNLSNFLRCAVIVLALTVVSYAAYAWTGNLGVNIETVSVMNVAVNQVTPAEVGSGLDDEWVEVDETTPEIVPLDFGILDFDDTWQIYRAPYYFVIDAGVADNTGNEWNIQYTTTGLNLIGGDPADPFETLSDNVNMVFVKQLGDVDGDPETPEEFETFPGLGNADGAISMKDSITLTSALRTFTRTELTSGTPGWLRIYVGLATGQNDAPNVVPVTINEVSGDYTGTITLTFTSS